MEPTTLPTFQNLPTHLREPFLRAVRTNPLQWLLPPHTDDEFESSEQCLARLQAFALGQGFAVVTGRVYREGTPRWQFRCIHHSSKTRNHRKLEEEVKKDSNSNILTNRKRDGHVQQKLDCQWECLLSYKAVSRGSSEKTYRLTVKCSDHSHELHSNPFAYKIHLKQTCEYKQLVNKSLNARITAVPYSVQRRVLDRDDLGITIDARTYYNLVRNSRGDKEQDTTISGLLIALDEAGFHYRTRVEEFLDDSGTIVDRKLLQIWFIHPEAVRFAQRFCAGKLLVVDGTFNTNELRLPLLTSVGITNTGKTFPVALSYCPGETAASYNFFFESLRSEVFVDGVADPGVIMGDQAQGLISSIDTYDSMPNSQLQFCIWHAAEAMKTRWQKNGYTSTQIDGIGDEPGLADLTWQYLKSPTLTDLTANRERLLAALRPAEVRYIQQNWVPKEDRVVVAYTRGYPNLGTSKRTTFCVELTSHSPPPPPLLPALTPSAGEHQVSGGEFKVSRTRGACLTIYALVARRSKPKMASLVFWRPFQDSCRVAMVEPLVSYLEPHGPPPLPARQASQLGLLAVLVWLVVRYLFDHRLPPAPSPPDCHHHGKKKGHSRRARSSRRSERLPEGGAPGRRQPSRRQ